MRQRLMTCHFPEEGVRHEGPSESSQTRLRADRDDYSADDGAYDRSDDGSDAALPDPPRDRPDCNCNKEHDYLPVRHVTRLPRTHTNYGVSSTT